MARTVNAARKARKASRAEEHCSREDLPDWTGATVAIVAGGKSVAGLNVDVIRGRARTIAINEAYRLCPWADLLYACDGSWWKVRKGAPEFTGIKVSQCSTTCRARPDIRKIAVRRCPDLILEPFGVVGSGAQVTGGNGGFQAINLAVQLGARRLILLGFDMVGAHWHGQHKHPLGNPHDRLFQEWRRVLDNTAPNFAELGIEILNCSEISKLTAYRKVSLEEALA